jgi:two-component system sensor histidine kinase VanS
MKYSIRLKLSCLLTALIIFTIFMTWLINRTFLDDFYLKSKTNAMEDAYHDVLSLYKKNKSGKLSPSEYEKLNKMKTKYDLDIYVICNIFDISYPSEQDMGDRENSQINSLLKEFRFRGSTDSISHWKKVKLTDHYLISSLFDKQTNVNYLDLFGSLGNYNVVFLRSNLERIEESVTISNRFLAYIGFIAAVIGTGIMFIVSKKFTDPIHDLAEMAQKMSELNFDVKYHGNTKDEIGNLGESINILSDKLETTITELKQANNELMSDIQKKTEVDEIRKEFLSNVSHELKTPIALIQGYAEGLKENVNEDEENRNFYCEVIMDEAGKMNTMVQKLLSLNELEFGNSQVNFERFDIVELITSVLGATEIMFRQKEVTLHFEEKEPVYVWADEFMVEQVLTNYISNALNHVSGTKIIEIKMIKHDDVVRIAVFNTGEPIPEDSIDKIWTKFYKVDKARTREYGGSGIGLSIVKAIMNSLNRECGVINRQIGVEFWFELDTKA